MALITKLESSVNDDNLLKIGELKVGIKRNSNFTISFSKGAGRTARIIGNGNFFTDSTYSVSAGKEVSLENSGTLYMSAGAYELVLNTKYLGGIVRAEIDAKNPSNTVIYNFDEFKYVSLDTFFYLTRCEIKNFNKMNFAKVIEFSCVDCDIEGDISKLNEVGIYFNVLNVSYNKKLVGNMNSLGNLKGCTSFNFTQSGVTGTPQSLALALKNNGKTSGSITVVESDGTRTVIQFPYNG